jgi:hypothetical protein
MYVAAPIELLRYRSCHTRLCTARRGRTESSVGLFMAKNSGACTSSGGDTLRGAFFSERRTWPVTNPSIGTWALHVRESAVRFPPPARRSASTCVASRTHSSRGWSATGAASSGRGAAAERHRPCPETGRGRARARGSGLHPFHRLGRAQAQQVQRKVRELRRGVVALRPRAPSAREDHVTWSGGAGCVQSMSIFRAPRGMQFGGRDRMSS